MILGSLQLGSIKTYSGLNILGLCCCDKDEDGGGSQFPESVNPFMKLRPVPGLESENTSESYDTLSDVDHGQEQISSKVMMNVTRIAGTDPRYKVDPKKLAEYKQILQDEEDAFLLTLIALDDGDRYVVRTREDY